jgi:hypothetical protein
VLLELLRWWILATAACSGLLSLVVVVQSIRDRARQVAARPQYVEPALGPEAVRPSA